MKKLLFLLITCFLFSTILVAQIKIISSNNLTTVYPVAKLTGDTLNVELGKIKFIKIGNTVYELETKLKEVQPLNNIWLYGQPLTVDTGWINKSTLLSKYFGNNTLKSFIPYNGTLQLPSNIYQSDLLWRGCINPSKLIIGK